MTEKTRVAAADDLTKETHQADANSLVVNERSGSGGKRMRKQRRRLPLPSQAGNRIFGRWAASRTEGAERQAGLPEPLRSRIEALSGLSMQHVRVFFDSAKPRDVQALAFAQGSEIHLGPGQERHLAHEAWHVVQQQQGRVQPTTLLRGVSINDDLALEREAEAMGAIASSAGPLEPFAFHHSGAARPNASIQRVQGLQPGDRVRAAGVGKGTIDAVLKEGAVYAVWLDEQGEVFNFDEPEVEPIEGTKLRLDHQAATAKLNAYLDEGLRQDQDIRLRNACEWIRQGQTKLYALVKTPDSDARVEAQGMNPDKAAAFFPNPDNGRGDVNDVAPPVDLGNLQDNAAFLLRDDGKRLGGINGDNYIGIIAIDNRAAFFVTLKHEVQHDADRHRDRGLTGREKSLEKFKTEYRAYRYEGGGFEKYGDEDVEKYGYRWSRRQLQIFEHLYEMYEEVRNVWDFEDQLAGEARANRTPSEKGQYLDVVAEWQHKTVDDYREAVVAYRDPDVEGFNKWDSVRIDAFYQALAAVQDGSLTVYLKLAIWRLKPEEARFVLLSKDFQRKLKSAGFVDERYRAIQEELIHQI